MPRETTSPAARPPLSGSGPSRSRAGRSGSNGTLLRPARPPRLGFNVYLGPGATPDYATPAAVVAYGSGLFNTFVADLSGLTDGAVYSIGVRAFNASGEEANTVTVGVTADATGPLPVDLLIATAIV